jgi:hypothetical protein
VAVTITITPAALRAALAEMRKLGAERQDNAEAAAFLIDGLIVLEALLDPAHQPKPAHWRTLHDLLGTPATPGDLGGTRHAPPESTIGPAAASLAAEEAQPAHAHHLPAGPEGGAVPAHCTPAGTDAPHPRRPEAPPPAQAAAGRGSKPRATPADDALLRELWPQPISMRDLVARFNAAASRPVKSDARLYERAARLGLPLPRHQAMAEAGHPVGGRGMVKGVWTADRTALLAARYPDEGLTPALMDALNALPGPPIVSANALKAHAHRHGLRRSPHAASRKRAAQAELARKAPAARRAERRAELAAMTPPQAAPMPPAEPPQAAPTAPDPTPEQQAAIADQALATKHARAKAKLRDLLAANPRDITAQVAGIAVGMKLPLREAMRLLGEVRMGAA